MKIYYLILLFFTNGFSFSHAIGNDIESTIAKAKYAYQQQRYNDALDILKPAVDSNHPLATYLTGIIHYQMTNASEPKFLALMYFGKAANLGYTAAYVDIGFAYQQGNGVTQDFNIAHKNFIMAFEGGDKRIKAIAAYAIGGLFLNGLCVEKSTHKANEWYQKSADLGYPDAKTILKEINSNND